MCPEFGPVSCNHLAADQVKALAHYHHLAKNQVVSLINPFIKIHEMQTEQTELIAFTREELDLVSTELPGYNHNLYVIALLIFNCFLRPQEIVRLQVRFFKNIGDSLSIPGSVSKKKE